MKRSGKFSFGFSASGKAQRQWADSRSALRNHHVRRSIAGVVLLATSTVVAVVQNERPAAAAPFDSVCPVVGIDQSGLLALPADGTPGVNGPALAPWEVVVDTDGSTYYATGTANVVTKIAPNGLVSRFAGTGVDGSPLSGSQATASPLDNPTKLALDRTRRRLYIGGTSGISRVDLTTNVITRAVGNGTNGRPTLGAVATASPFGPTSGFDVAGNGDLVVAFPFTSAVLGTDVLRIPDGTGVISRYAGTGSGTNVTVSGPRVSTTLPYSTDVTIDSAGTIYLLTDLALLSITNTTVTRLNADPPSGSSGDGPIAGLRLTVNNAVAYDPTTNALFIVGGDMARGFTGSRVRRVDLAAGLATTTYSGTDVQGSGSLGDGLPRTDASVHFFAMRGVAVGPDGSVIVSDSGNNRIRKIAPGAAGLVSTLAGNSPVPGSGLGANPLAMVLGAPNKVAFDAVGTMYIVPTPPPDGCGRSHRTVPPRCLPETVT
jgi:hypothetical protein